MCSWGCINDAIYYYFVPPSQNTFRVVHRPEPLLGLYGIIPCQWIKRIVSLSLYIFMVLAFYSYTNDRRSLHLAFGSKDLGMVMLLNSTDGDIVAFSFSTYYNQYGRRCNFTITPVHCFLSTLTCHFVVWILKLIIVFYYTNYSSSLQHQWSVHLPCSLWNILRSLYVANTDSQTDNTQRSKMTTD